MSGLSRFIRIKKGAYNLHRHLKAQDKAIVALYAEGRLQARKPMVEWNPEPDTRAEWDRLKHNRDFRVQADPFFILSYEKFKAEFGLCPEPRFHLCKIENHFVTWINATCEWRKLIGRRG